ncbi:protein B4 isoform X2 [Alosa sapidissima]|uniref:protein B4 isoform X2 n=1 Tax=Alosa sapidissima TaxID=34773 RepID=UPI001C0871B9|nr:protein B4 isoform X2 [Alosa sapidissima]
MGPKRAAAVKDEVAAEPEMDTEKEVKQTKKAKTDGGGSNKTPTAPKSHPSTMVMVEEALKELDSRKGVSAQAVRTYIIQKYPSVDPIRLKYMVRRALSKGLESGALVRPANSTAIGAQGKFRVAVKSKAKKPVPKTQENADPNKQKSPKATKTKPKPKESKDQEPGVKKTKAASKKETDASDAKPTKAKGGAASKVAPAKKPKAKAAGEAREGPAKPKAKTLKAAKASEEAESKPAGQKRGAKTQKAAEDAEAKSEGAKAKGPKGKKAAE